MTSSETATSGTAPAQRTRRSAWLVALQTEATVLMTLAFGQAGLAAGFLTGQRGLKAVHAVNGTAVAVLTVALLGTAVGYRVRRSGPRWIVLATALVLAYAVVQVALGALEVKGAHMFLGTGFVVVATLLTSYLFRPGFTPRP